MVVGFHFHQDVGQFLTALIHLIFRVEACNFRTFDDRGVIGISHDGALRVQLMRVFDHLEQGFILLFAIHDPVRIKNFVTAMLTVCLCKHHQLNVGRITACFRKRIGQIIDFVIRHCQTKRDIRRYQCFATTAKDIHEFQWLSFQFGKQRTGFLQIIQYRFSHAVMQQRRNLYTHCRIQWTSFAEQTGFQLHKETDTTLNAANMLHTTVVNDIRRFTGPRRDRADTWCDNEYFTAGFAGKRLPISQQSPETRNVIGAQFRSCINKVLVSRSYANNTGINLLEPAKEAVSTKSG